MGKINFSSKVIFVMGVSGSGKSSVGLLLANELSVPFIDADDHHPPSNIEKMSQGIPLNDGDRAPWLDRLNELAKKNIPNGCVIACSALKEAYRSKLMQSIHEQTIWVYLKGTYDQIFDRMSKREDHYMGATMLKSQFDQLEEPDNVISLDISDSPDEIVKKIKLEQK